MMKTLLRKPLGTLTMRSLFGCSNNSDKSSLVPMPIDVSEKFYKNVYGIEMKKHILPFNSYNFPWRA